MHQVSTQFGRLRTPEYQFPFPYCYVVNGDAIVGENQLGSNIAHFLK